MTAILKNQTTDPKSVEIVFDEAKRAALGWIERNQRMQEQAEYIIATAYVNLKCMNTNPELLQWMDTEILKLNAIKTGSLESKK